MFGKEKRMCRCCLSSSTSMVYAASVRQAILELAGITVHTSDGLPQWICTQCVALLRKAIRFRSKILRNDSILRDYLANCTSFSVNEQDPELTKHATQHLTETQILQFDMSDKSKNGHYKVLQHVKTIPAVFHVECKIEYNESIVKLEQEYSDIEDDMPLLELRSSKEDFVSQDDNVSKTVKLKKDSTSKKKRKEYQNESEKGENRDEIYNDISILEPLESTDPLLEPNEDINDLENIKIDDENFQNKLQYRYQLKYLRFYKRFLQWKKEKNITAFTENVFLTYFKELDLKCKPATLISTHSMLKTTLFAHKRINIGNYSKLKKFISDRTKNYCVKRSKVFKKEEIDQFLKTAPDNLYLSTKVALILGVCGGCMTPDLLNLTVKDVEIQGNLIVVKVHEKINRERSFMIPENYSEYVRKYMKLRPKDLGFDRFLVHYKNGVFAKAGMGINKAKMTARNVASFLKLQNPDKYNAHGLKKMFNALFNHVKGSAHDLSLNESDNDKRESKINNDTAKMVNINDTTVNLNNMANSNDITEDFNDETANSSDEIANVNDEMTDSNDSIASLAKLSNNDRSNTSTGNNKEDFVSEDDNISKRDKRKRDSKSKKKYQNDSENDDENQDETFNDLSILEPLESTDPLLEPNEDINDLENIKIDDENFQKGLQYRNQLKYLSSYKRFLQWKKEKNITAFTENVFLTYFKELDLKCKPGTLITTYSMLKTTLFAQKRINIGNYSKLKKFISDRTKNYCVKRSKVFKKEEIDRFLKTAPDNLYLSTKVVLILAVSGGCMTPDLVMLTVNDVEIHGNLIVVKVHEKFNRERSFMIPENYSEYVRKYMKLRPKDLGFDRFLVHYKDGVFAKAGMGINKAKMTARSVASFLKLRNPERYNAHALKKTFYALFDQVKGSAYELFLNESDEECENRVNESENGQNDGKNQKYEIENTKNKSENRNNKSEDTENESEINNDKIAEMVNISNSYDTTVNFNKVANSNDITEDFNDKIANSSDEIANVNDEMTDSNDSIASLAKFSNKDCNKTSTGRILKVPEKSAQCYVRAYKIFARWMQGKSIKTVTEKIMMEYFKHLREEKRPSSLWNIFSMLRNTILIRNNVDIKKFERLKQFLKANFKTYEMSKKKSKSFTEMDIELFLSSAPDYNYLTMKVILLIGIRGACSGRELNNLTTDCVRINKNTIIVKIKTGNNKRRRFSISGDYYEYVKRYMSLRPKNLGHNRFFFTINNKNYAKQFFSKHTVRLTPKEIASFLVLPEPEAYNGICFRRTSVALFGRKICTIENENHSESENDSESDSFPIEPVTIKNSNNDSLNETDNGKIEIKYEPLKIQNIKRDFEYHNESGIYEPMLAQNIKQELDENTTIQDNCTYIQENSAGKEQNNTNTQENSTETQDNSTNLANNETQRRYFHNYGLFQTWMIENDITSYSENVLLKYFEELSKTVKPASLQTKYSMLRLTIKLETGIDISKYMALKKYIHKNNEGVEKKKSRVFSLKEVEEFLNDAPDYDYLHWKVALIIGITGACTCRELTDLKIENVKICGKIVTVKILSSKSKRKFFIKEKYAHFVKKYMEMRPKVCKNRFFLTYRNNRCVKQVLGRNYICGIPQNIAKYMNLQNPEEFMGYCFKTTSFSLFGRKRRSKL